MNREKVLLHLDMDCYYVSVERLLNPALVGKPVAVGGAEWGRGVVSSASYEARAHGVRSAMPMGRARQLCPGLVVVSGSMEVYTKYSRRIRELLEEFTPLVQMASQDEAYMDLTGTERLWGPPLAAAEKVRARVAGATGLPCSVGLATNKLVAKVASGLCKPSALLHVPPGSEEAFLAPLPVRRLPGVGPKAAERLRELGITCIGDIARMGGDRLQRLFGNHGFALAERARGIAHGEVEIDSCPKSIGAEETFTRDTCEARFIDSILAGLSEKVASRLRAQDAAAQTVTLKYRYENFETHTAAESFTSPTDDEGEILGAARRLLAKKASGGRPLRLVGVTAGNLLFGEIQEDLFGLGEEREKRRRLHAALDTARRKHGFSILRRGNTAREETQG